MKTVVLSALRPIVAIDPLWRVLDQGLRFSRMFDVARQQVTIARGPEGKVREVLEQLCPGARVQRGLCAGLQFPPERSAFSTVAPMLLGIYERPLQDRLLELTQTRNYDTIVDVGAADGFYAVGLALRCPAARVIACDTEPIAQRASRAMAELNGVSSRFEMRGHMDAQSLPAVVRDARRALILSDCERYEKQLFPAGSGEALARHDVVIETHDQLDYSISPHLKSVFAKSHRVEMLRADDDLQTVRRAHEFLPELAQFDWPIRHALVSENRRNVPGEWLIAQSLIN